MLRYRSLILNSVAFIPGMGLRSIIPTRHFLTPSSTPIFIKIVLSFMSRYRSLHDAPSASALGTCESSRNPRADRTWDASKGIKFSGLTNGENLLGQQSLKTTHKKSEHSGLTKGLHSDTELAHDGSAGFIEIDENQNLAEEAAPPITNIAPGPHEDTTLAALSGAGPLGYHIPEARMRSPSTYWLYTLYQGPRGEEVKLHYCRSKETSERIARLFLDQEVVGFDLEWKPQASAKEGIRKNVASIQLASEERIALFHLARYRKGDTIDDFVAPSLRKVLESPAITKAGVAIKGDCTRLRRYLGIDSRGLLELSHLYKLVKFSAGDVTKINKSLVSLARQVEEHLRLPLCKGEVRSSDWSQELTYEQIRYAASDSYAGFQLYHSLESKRKALCPTPPRPAHAELNCAIRVATGERVAAYEESTEGNDVTSSTADPEAMLSVEEMARDFINGALANGAAPTSVVKGQESKHSGTFTYRIGSEIAAANAWIAQWHCSLPSGYKPRAMGYQLRAYALWHEQQHDIATVASFLRDPPLKLGTVVSYVLEALRRERLPFDATRLVEMVNRLPQPVHNIYASFFKSCGVTNGLNGREGTVNTVSA